MPNICFTSFVPPFGPGDIVARHALKDPDWTLSCKAAHETDLPVTIDVPLPLAAPADESDATQQNAVLRQQLVDLPARAAMAEATAAGHRLEVEALQRKLAVVADDYHAAQTLLVEQSHRIAHLEAQAAITASAK